MIETSFMAQNICFSKCLSFRYFVYILHGYKSFKIDLNTPKMLNLQNMAF